MRYIDTHFTAPDYPLDLKPEIPKGFDGGVAFGKDAKQRNDEFTRWSPRHWWRHAETLDAVVGENNARFPSRSAFVIDLKLPPDDLNYWLRNPSKWWPLGEAMRDMPRMLRLNLEPGVKNISGAKQIIRKFGSTKFLIDPFVHGPVTGWQGHVRLAESGNVFLTTLGLYPGPQSLWSVEQAEEALHFLSGEVGARALMYASGLEWDDIAVGDDQEVLDFYLETKALYDEDRSLVIHGNARELIKQAEALRAGLP